MAEGESQNSFAAVAQGDAIFRAEEAAKPTNPLTEGLALRELFGDASMCLR